MPDGPCVYLLRCADDSLYCGWTVDLPKRLAAHAAGTGAKYTRTRLPVALAAAFPMDDATAARKEEARIKALSRAQKLALISGPTGRPASAGRARQPARASAGGPSARARRRPARP